MSKRSRRHHSSEQKAELLKKHLVEKVPVSDICDAHQLQPSLFYYWQRQLFDNAQAAFEPGKSGAASREKELEARIAQLEAKLSKKDAVIAEISEEYVALKKELGEP
jgi:transposase